MATGPIANIAGSSFQAGAKVPQDVHVVDASGIAVSFGGSGGTSETDGAPFNNDTTVGTPAMGAYQSSPDALTDGDLGIVALDVNRNLKVNVAAGGTSGTQYTEGDTDATITGTAALAEGAGNALVPLLVDASQHLQVDLAASSVTVAVSNAGLTALNGAVAGSEVQVDIVAALPAGTNNIGDVDVLSVVPGTAATNLGKAEDAAHTTGDVGVMALAVRSDSGGAIAGTDGDYTPLQVDSNGALRVTGGGGGTEYTEGDTDATFTGGMALMEGAANTVVPLQGTAADGLLVNLGANNDVTGTVTANAGTNLNTSALALEAGGNLAAAATSLAILDDWDETDRAKVNIIAGQAGVAAGAGAVGATVQRVTLASDDPGTVALQIIDDWDESDRAKVNLVVGQAGITAGAGAVAANTPRVTHASDDPAVVALQLIDNPVLVDDAAFTPATSSVNMAGYQADETATDSVDEGDAGAARMTLDRKQIVTLQPHTTGGLSTFMASGSDGSSILVATAQAIKASAGQLYGYYLYNPEAAVTFVHFYNTAQGSVTVGTTNPLFTIPVPAASAANLMFPHGVTFSNAGWSCAATTTAGGNTAPATGVSLVVWYV